MDLLPRDMFGQIAVIMNGLMFSKVYSQRSFNMLMNGHADK
jgi:hypothetical protein